MGESTAIEWTDATWNPWRGCDKVSPGCAHCYMFRDQRRYGRDPSVVVRAADPTFQAPLKAKWHQRAAEIRETQGRRMRVFTCSWSDWFHEDADPWRDEAWSLIRFNPEFDFQILTKRPERIAECLPFDWGDGYPNVWLGVSIENRRFVHRADLLRAVPAAVRFISAEPLLGPLLPKVEGDEDDCVAWWPDGRDTPCVPYDGLELLDIDWLIVGGESGPGYRRIDLEWVRVVPRRNPSRDRSSLRRSCPLPGRPSLVLGHGPEERPGEPLARRAARHGADVDGEHLTTRRLDSRHDLFLHRQRTDQAVEVGGDDHLSASILDELDRAPKALAALERGAAGNVEFLDRLGQLEAVALTRRDDALSLFDRGGERLALSTGDLRHADDPHGTPLLHGRTLFHSVGRVSTQGCNDNKRWEDR